MKTTRWGILGCGGIAKAFAKGLLELDDAKLVACASSTLEKAQGFSQEFDCSPCADYQELVTRNDVDVIYIATTHNFHYHNAQLCLNHGKHVLCEKPMTVNAQQTADLMALAKNKGLFLMEAMWTRFIPATRHLLTNLDSGIIGDIRLVQADFGIHNDWPKDGRMLNPALAGGALLDLGIYPLTFAWLVMGGEPDTIASTWTPTETGVDEQSAYLLTYADGAMAQLWSGMRTKTPHQGRIYGSKGRIVIDDFFHARGYTIYHEDGSETVIEQDYTSTGYQFEAAEVGKCLNNNLTESPLCPMNETLAIMRQMDTMRQEWGLRYPCE